MLRDLVSRTRSSSLSSSLYPCNHAHVMPIYLASFWECIGKQGIGNFWKPIFILSGTSCRNRNICLLKREGWIVDVFLQLLRWMKLYIGLLGIFFSSRWNQVSFIQGTSGFSLPKTWRAKSNYEFSQWKWSARPFANVLQRSSKKITGNALSITRLIMWSSSAQYYYFLFQ